MGEAVYITKDAILWARTQLKSLPTDQFALFWCLIFQKAPKVSSPPHLSDPFVKEFHRYFGAPIPGGGIGVFNPIDSKWKAEQYIQSTVYGRLLNGSHWWTSTERGFLKRNKKDGWPAEFTFDSDGAKSLFLRPNAPSTSACERLPLSAVAIHYYKFDTLDSSEVNSIDSLTKKYQEEVVNQNPYLQELFALDSTAYWGSPLSENPLSDQDAMSCFPPSPYSGESKQNALLYTEDIKYMQGMLKEGETLADLVRTYISRP